MTLTKYQTMLLIIFAIPRRQCQMIPGNVGPQLKGSFIEQMLVSRLNYVSIAGDKVKGLGTPFEDSYGMYSIFCSWKI